MGPLSSESGTYETVTARFWHWLSDKNYQIVLSSSLFARERSGRFARGVPDSGEYEAYLRETFVGTHKATCEKPLLVPTPPPHALCQVSRLRRCLPVQSRYGFPWTALNPNPASVPTGRALRRVLDGETASVGCCICSDSAEDDEDKMMTKTKTSVALSIHIQQPTEAVSSQEMRAHSVRAAETVGTVSPAKKQPRWGVVHVKTAPRDGGRSISCEETATEASSSQEMASRATR